MRCQQSLSMRLFNFIPTAFAPFLQVPKDISDQLEEKKDNDEAIKKLGIELGTKMCRKLLDNGVPGLHMYTLNLDRSALAILENLGLIKGRVGVLASCPPHLARVTCTCRHSSSKSQNGLQRGFFGGLTNCLKNVKGHGLCYHPVIVGVR